MAFFKFKDRRITREDLIADMIRVSVKIKSVSCPRKSYIKYGKFSYKVFYYEFGSWNKAIEAAGLRVYAAEYSSLRRRPTAQLRMEVLMRDKLKCVKCGASPAICGGVVLAIDHIVPVSKGGLTVIENLQTLCTRCNIDKGDKSPVTL